jgi:hypothetical protein
VAGGTIGAGAGPTAPEEVSEMRRFLLLVFVACAGASVAFSLWPRQLGAFVALFGQRATVNRGVAVTVLTGLVLALVAQRLRLWRAERDLARARSELARPVGMAGGPPPWGSPPYASASWGSRPAR